MAVDGMAARARRLAELEAAYDAREAQAHDRWGALADRAAALGQPIPPSVAGRLDAVFAARTHALETRGEALGGFERTLAEWSGALDRSAQSGHALTRLRERLRQTLADEVGELSPAELSRLVARALGEHRRTGPLPPVRVDAPPPAGVEQEAQLLGRLMGDDPIEPERQPARGEPAARPDPTLRDRPPPDDPFDAFEAADARPLHDRAGPENEALVTMVSAAPADIGVLLDGDDPRPLSPRKLSREPPTDTRLSIDIEIEVDVDDDPDSGEAALARWLGRPSDPPPMSPPGEDALDASIEALDEADSLLEWEATGLGNEVAMLVERRRPAAARTSIIEVVDDPFDAFDDFDDSLDAPFGFVDNVTGQGPALADADWSLSGRSEAGEPETAVDPQRPTPDPAEASSLDFRPAGPPTDGARTGDDGGRWSPETGPSRPRPGTGPAVQRAPTGGPTEASPDGSFEVLLLDDPFEDSSLGEPNRRPWSPRSSPSPSGAPGSTDSDPATDVDHPVRRPEARDTASGRGPVTRSASGRGDTDDLLHGVDMQEAFPAIGAPLGADSMEEVVPLPDAAARDAREAFEAALGAAFARSASRPGSADSLDLELDAAFAEQPVPAPAAAPAPVPTRITDRPTARPRRAPSPRPEADHSPPGGSLLPAPPVPGSDGWGPRTLAEQAAIDAEEASAIDSEASAVDDEAPDHVPTGFGAALVDPTSARNPFEVPLITLPAPAPPMATAAADSTEPGRPFPALERASATADRGARSRMHDIEAALAHAEATELAAEGSGIEALGDAHLTGLDWPPPRALHAFPDGSIDQSGESDGRAQGPRRAPTGPTRDRPMPAARPAPRPSGGMPVDVVTPDGRSGRGATDDRPGPGPGRGGMPSDDSDDMGSDAMAVDVMASRALLAAHLPMDAIPTDTLPTGGHPRHAPPVEPSAGHGIQPTRPAPEAPVDDWAGGAGESADGSASEPDPRGADRARPDAGWRSTAVAPSAAAPRSASLADALHAARDVRGLWRPTRDDLDAVLDGLEAPDPDEQRGVTDRFAALAGTLAADPWASLDIPDHRSAAPDRLPELMRQRRQGRPVEPQRTLPGGGGTPLAEPEEETAPRASLGVRVGLEAGDRFFTGFSRDISVDGIFVGTQHGLAVGEPVEVFFELPGGRSINARGTVRRVRRGEGGQASGLGIRFEQLTREARVHIGRYVSRTLTGKIPLP